MNRVKRYFQGCGDERSKWSGQFPGADKADELQNHDEWAGGRFGEREAIVIGHDWGCYAASRLWQYHPDRIFAVAFFALEYIPPTDFDIAALNALSKQTLGYENFGYQLFLRQRARTRRSKAMFV